MRKSGICAVAAVLLALTVPATATAQAILYFGGGASFPTGDFNDFGDGDGAETGWFAVGGVLFPVGEGRIAVGAEGLYGQNNHEAVEGDKTNPIGLMGTVGVLLTDGEQTVRPYIVGGAGLLVHRFSPDSGDSESDSNFGYMGGAGLDFAVGGTTGIFVEVRYVGSSDTTFFGTLAGLSFGVG